MNAHVRTPASAPVGDGRKLAQLADFLDPESMPDLYGMLAAGAFPRHDIEPGDILFIDKRLAPAIGDLVLVYFKPGSEPMRMVTELATSIPPAFADGSEVVGVVALRHDDGPQVLMAPMREVLAIHRIYERKRDHSRKVPETSPSARAESSPSSWG